MQMIMIIFLPIIMIIFLTDNHDLHFSDFFKVGEYESSEPTSLATTSTMEGEHTLSPGAGEEGGEGLGEVGFPGEHNLVLSCQSSTVGSSISAPRFKSSI